MGILKITSIIFFIVLSSCREPRIYRHEYDHKRINIENWDLKQDTIKKAVLYSYKKNSNFKILEGKFTQVKVTNNDSRNFISLLFDSLPIINLKKDYKLIINDTVTYRLKNINTSYSISRDGPNRIDSLYNMIKSFNLNNKEYKFDKPRVFLIPKDAYTIEK